MLPAEPFLMEFEIGWIFIFQDGLYFDSYQTPPIRQQRCNEKIQKAVHLGAYGGVVAADRMMEPSCRLEGYEPVLAGFDDRCELFDCGKEGGIQPTATNLESPP